MRKSTSSYPGLAVEATGSGVVSQAGAVALARTAQATGLTTALSAALMPWRKPLASHDPGKIVCDLAITLAIGGDCLADIAMLRSEPGVFGVVASDPTVSRLITTLAADATAALEAIATARASARSAAWKAAGDRAPGHGVDADHPLIVDLDATLVTAHSDKQSAAPTHKRGFGFHPMCAFADHGPGGTGEPLAILLRPGNAGANRAADHVTVVKDALAQLPIDTGYRVGRKVLVRADAGGATHDFLNYLTKRRLSYSIGFGLTETIACPGPPGPTPTQTDPAPTHPLALGTGMDHPVAQNHRLSIQRLNHHPPAPTTRTKQEKLDRPAALPRPPPANITINSSTDDRRAHRWNQAKASPRL